MPAPACAADHFGNRLRVKGVDAGRLTQFGLLHWRAAIDGATAASAGIEHLFPARPVVMPARRVALHGVDGALAAGPRRSRSALHASAKILPKPSADNHQQRVGGFGVAPFDFEAAELLW